MGDVGFPELSQLLPANSYRGADSGGAARSAGPGQRVGPAVGIAGWKARTPHSAFQQPPHGNMTFCWRRRLISVNSENRHLQDVNILSGVLSEPCAIHMGPPPDPHRTPSRLPPYRLAWCQAVRGKPLWKPNKLRDKYRRRQTATAPKPKHLSAFS